MVYLLEFFKIESCMYGIITLKVVNFLNCLVVCTIGFVLAHCSFTLECAGFGYMRCHEMRQNLLRTPKMKAKMGMIVCFFFKLNERLFNLANSVY